MTSPSIGSTIPPSSPAQSDLASVSVNDQTEASPGTSVIGDAAEAPTSGADGTAESLTAEGGDADAAMSRIANNTEANPAEASSPEPVDAAAVLSAAPAPTPLTTAALAQKADDPDFPARTANRAQALYNPSPSKGVKGSLAATKPEPSNTTARGGIPRPGGAAPGANGTVASNGKVAPARQPALHMNAQSAPAPAPVPPHPPVVLDENGMTPEDVIEAKLRAISGDVR